MSGDRPEEDVAGADSRADVERRTELWAAARRQERLLAACIGLGALLGTLYFAAVNAYLILRAQPAPAQLSFEHPRGAAGTYGVHVAWRPLAGVASPGRPRLSLGGARIPEDGADAAPAVSLEDARELRVEVGTEATPGRHEGELLLTRRGDPAFGPEVLSAPVVVGVTAGLWQSWFLVRNWLMLAVALVLLCYLLCLAIFPRPSGSLAIARLGTGRVDSTRLRLDRRPLAVLMPWLRSSLPFDLLGRLAAMPDLAGVPGRIEFQFAGVPLLVVEDPSEQWRVDRTPTATGGPDEPAPDAFSRSAPVAIMHGDVFRFSRVGGGTEVRIQYVRAGAAL